MTDTWENYSSGSEISICPENVAMLCSLYRWTTLIQEKGDLVKTDEKEDDGAIYKASPCHPFRVTHLVTSLLLINSGWTLLVNPGYETGESWVAFFCLKKVVFISIIIILVLRANIHARKLPVLYSRESIVPAHRPNLVFVKEVLLEHSHANLFMYLLSCCPGRIE